MHSYTKDEARTIVMQCAKTYSQKLVGRKFIFIFRDKVDNYIKFFEVYFGKENYQHLTGVDLLDREGKARKNVAGLFFTKCLNNKLRKDEIQFKKDGTTNLKLVALPTLMKIEQVTKIVGECNGIRPYLVADKLMGNTKFCLGLLKDSQHDFYVPASSLLEDIRKMTYEPSQVLAIFSKEKTENIYKKICYVAKGLNLNNINLPQEIMELISLEDYVPKSS